MFLGPPFRRPLAAAAGSTLLGSHGFARLASGSVRFGSSVFLRAGGPGSAAFAPIATATGQHLGDLSKLFLRGLERDDLSFTQTTLNFGEEEIGKKKFKLKNMESGQEKLLSEKQLIKSLGK